MEREDVGAEVEREDVGAEAETGRGWGSLGRDAAEVERGEGEAGEGDGGGGTD